MTIPTQASDDISRLAGQFNIYSQLLRNRIVMLWDQVDDEFAKEITAQLLYLEGEDSEKDIWLYINSPGGSVTAGMAIYDTMQLIKPDVSTLCLGLGASMGQFLLGAGAQGKRYSLKHARIMMHQPSGGIQGQASDIEIHAQELLLMKKKVNEILSKHTGKSLKTVEKDTDRDNYLTAKQAKTYGLIDNVLKERK